MSLGEIVEVWADFYDSYIGYGTGDILRNAWRELVNNADPCDCPPTHHRWNCHRTPVYRQTMRDLDINPWMLFEYQKWPITAGGYQ